MIRQVLWSHAKNLGGGWGGGGWVKNNNKFKFQISNVEL